MSEHQIYRMRAPASGREAFVEADPDGVYVDRETGEELKPVTRVLPLAPSPGGFTSWSPPRGGPAPATARAARRS